MTEPFAARSLYAAIGPLPSASRFTPRAWRSLYAAIGPLPCSAWALRASAALRSALVYWFQWGLHITPKPSLRLGWIGKSSGGASCASIANVLLGR